MVFIVISVAVVGCEKSFTFEPPWKKEPAQRGPERQSSQRFTTRSLIEVRLPTWTALQSVYTVNLSMGGMRISLGARVAIGTAIDIIFSLPNGERLHLPGKVAYLGPGETATLACVSTRCRPTRTTN